MKYTALKEYLAAAKAEGNASLRPCYVIFGDDAWLRQSAVGMFRALADPDYAAMNCTVLSAQDGAEEAVFTLNTFPVFDTIRIVVVTDGLSAPCRKRLCTSW